MTKGTIGLNAGTIWNLLLDGGCWSFEELKKRLHCVKLIYGLQSDG